ncbi:tyrosine-protein kinase hopscotch isoform X2 [Culicoides brevitarsis]|uniref:tyrosine-protein kinase hopscotch isoform X2 n=1 Tax=Culicoides brevitarsis TaxID=469753 RepID=UPI00307C95A6
MPEYQMRMSSKIFNYTTNEFEIVRYEKDETCEEVCRRLCIQHDFTPIVETLFGLRYADSQQWLPGCKKLDPNVQYEFRLRFKLDPVRKLSDLDKEAYDYYYFQVRHDLLAQEMPGLDYSEFTNRILGLCTTDMYRELIERKSTEEELKRNYKNYIPRHIKRHHRLFVKRRIYSFLDNIKHKSHDKFFIREAYLKDIHKIAPDYLTETFVAESNYLPEHGYTDRGIVQIKIQVTPHHKEQPGIRIFYPYKDTCEHYRMEDVISIMNDTHDNSTILLVVNRSRDPMKFTIKDPQIRESLITCVAGYYRLMVKWTYNICNDYPSPLLNKLLEMKCHGPVGGAFSYKKLERNGFKTGNYIIRQCEENFGHFLIDIVIRNEPETFKIVQKGTKFIFHKRDGTTETFNELDQLAKSIELPPGETHLRFSPISEKDKPVKLLLCATPETLQAIEKVKDFNAMENRAPRIINKQSLLLHKQTGRDIDFNRMVECQADLLLPTNKRIDCKIKYLKLTLEREFLSGFMDLADLWANIDSQDILRLYGVTLQSNNRCLILESYQCDMKRFLRDKKQRQQRVPTINLIDATQCLAKAVLYLQDSGIVHGRIRCCNVFVKSYDKNSSLIVKLGDPGLPRLYDISDMPWIPVEHYQNLEKAKTDVKTDVWAFATTIWEIFSHGADINIPNPVQFFANGSRLSPPEECRDRKEIWDIMKEGWDEDPDKRFSTQFVLSRLTIARNRIDSNYSEINTERHYRISEAETNYTSGSVRTEDTFITDHFPSMSNGNGYSHSSLNSMNSSMNSLAMASGDEILQPFLVHEAEEFERDLVNQIITIDNDTITFKTVIGEGNFGKVYKGTLLDGKTETMTSVALKVLPTSGKGKLNEALQEAKLMQKLDHPNIVKILMYKEFSCQLVIVMELMKNESLDIYLKINRPKIKSIKLMKFAKDIASGMQYLQTKQIVHRDLAARNVLVESDNCVKISDFGLARFTSENDYYSVQTTDRALPILWHAPEAIRHNKFSSLSDVWSFGIVLFEMFSCGEKPYEKLNNRYTGADRSTQLPLALDKFLEDGGRMDRPDNCPEIVFEQIIDPCWEYDPHSRPTFTDLLITIDKIIESHNDDVEFNKCYTCF